jgi:hypothetical protein
MEGFVRRENIRRYRKLLREVKDEPGRRLIRKLLLEEEQKEVPLQMPSLPTARIGVREPHPSQCPPGGSSSASAHATPARRRRSGS